MAFPFDLAVIVALSETVPAVERTRTTAANGWRPRLPVAPDGAYAVASGNESNNQGDGAMKPPGMALLMLALGYSSALADEPVSFQGKTITVVVTSAAGSGTDLSARVVAD